MRWVLCLTMLAAVGFAPAPVYRPSKNDDDPEKLQGTWRSTAFRVEGLNIDTRATWKFDKGNLDAEQLGQIAGCCYRVDTRSNPKVIQVEMLGRVDRIFYEFEGDSLIVRYVQASPKVGKSVPFGGGEGRYLIVFERRKAR